MNVHPLAGLFPLLEGAALDDLVEDIKTHGLRSPITLYQGAILDGRNRHRACELAHVAPRFETYDGDDPLGFVISLNLKRRHLDESQRAMVGEKVANLPEGRPSKTAPIGVVSQPVAAKMLNVSTRSVQRAHQVRTNGTPDLVRAVEQGKIKVSVAAKLAERDAETQAAAVAAPGRAPHIAKQKAREAKMTALATRQAALSMKRYGVILADPPWRFEPWSRQTGLDRAADNHYPTMTLDEIKALKVPAADDCVLFLWATSPMLPQALEVMAAWGFSYKSSCVWVKDKAGTGYWFRNRHELLLVGVRGDIPAPAPGDQWDSVIAAPVGAHSAKPFAFREMIDELFPMLPSLEMFAREQFAGWDVWGLEAPG